jgi:[ribosomal protein S5]-alanine N-acetyltransferase
MLSLQAPRLTLIANDSTLAALQAEDPARFYQKVGALAASSWPPEPFDAEGLQWVRSALQTDPDGEGWYGWVLLADAGEGRKKLVGAAVLVGRPDFDGEVELGFGVLPEARGQGFAGEAIQTLVDWALSNGASRVVVHFDAADEASKRMLGKNGFIDSGEIPYPGVARWVMGKAS